ncbi:MAG: hypothetical protein ACRC7R_12195, partial [Sarcina sp.]
KNISQYLFDFSRRTNLYYVYIQFNEVVVVIRIIVILLLILLISIQLTYIKELILPTRKSIVEIVVVIISVCVMGFITYRYANNFINYFIGVLGIILFITIWLKEGITSKGFTSIYSYKKNILWNEVEKFDIHKAKNIKITLFGNFMEQSFKFRSEDYHKLMNILNDNLHK